MSHGFRSFRNCRRARRPPVDQSLIVTRYPIAIAVAILLAGVLGAAHRGDTASLAQPGPRAVKGSIELTALDRSADPCTDFYQFACGGWISANPVPADRASWSRFDELGERNLAILRRILDAAAAQSTGDTQQIGDYYASCMDEPAIDAKGRTPLDQDLKKIDALADRGSLPALLASLHASGVNAFFRFGSAPDYEHADTELAVVAPGGLGLPDRDYYFRDDPKSAGLRQQYVAHVEMMDTLAGAGRDRAGADAATVMRIETALARARLDVVARRDPAKVNHKMTVAELQALAPTFDWPRYFATTTAPAFTSLNVSEPDFLKAFDALLASTPIPDLRTYLRWHLVHATAFILSAPFVRENFRFYGTVLTGQPEQRARWKRCVDYTDSDLGEALGKAYVAEAFGGSAKADTLKMVHAIEATLEQDIQGLTWMTADTKQQAIVKLHAVAEKIGYPDRWRDYSALRIVRGDALGNSERANAFEFHRQIDKIGRAVDRREWEMTPPTVNAYYEPQENNINFPAGILQPPFYHPGGDQAVNFGSAGAVVGHELTHGFDDQGRQYDAKGNLHDWWKPEDAKAFDSRAACFVDEYSGFTAVDDVKVNGKLTLGENIADNGGLRLALMAYLAAAAGATAQPLDGFTPEQRLFIGFGQIWCENTRPETARMRAQTNPHSPGRFRANGVVSNMPEFQKAFSCRADAPMVRANACRVW
jgi:endothelin-converting enzyme/putative endopeptidase